MPIVKVHRRAGRPSAENRQVLDAIHASLIEAFKIPVADRNQILFAHEAAAFEIAAGRTDAFTLIEITAFPGRSLEAKRKLYQALATRCEAAGVGPADLFVVLTEPPLENWSPRDGVSSVDAKPSFKLDV